MTRQNSLADLTRTFLSRLPALVAQGQVWEFSVTQVEHSLGAKRSAVYELLNVFQACQLVTKLSFADRYRWNG